MTARSASSTQAVLDHVDEVAGRSGTVCRSSRSPYLRWAAGSGGDGAWLGIAEPGRVQAAQRLVERRDVADLGVVGEQREHVSSPSTSSTKPCSAFFGPTSTKTRAPASYSVLQALDELHR